MLTIRHKRRDYIGCGVCAEVAPNYWSMDEEGLARLSQTTGADGPFQIARGFADDFEILKEAADQCPVSIIRIEK